MNIYQYKRRDIREITEKYSTLNIPDYTKYYPVNILEEIYYEENGEVE